MNHLLIAGRTWIGVLLLVTAAGCKDASVDPVLFGEITGTVRYADTGTVVEGAQVTTSPPTNSLVTGDSGTFRFEDVETGNYTITVSKTDYSTSSTTVSVRRNQTTQAEILLRREATGRIEGRVVDADTQEALANVGVTTEPPSGAVVTAEDGTFTFDEIEVGDYRLAFSRSGYRADSVAVSVRENQTATATVQLSQLSDVPVGALSVEITNWGNRSVSDDSVFVWIDYRAVNVGSADIGDYEVYFRIDADGEQFLGEAEGDSLHISQADNRTFERFIFGRTADAVSVEGTWLR
jgi:hypothetical protein